MDPHPLLVVALVVISGCTGLPGGFSPMGQDEATASPTPTATPSPTATPLPPNNPWHADPVVVTINASTTDRDFSPVVQGALSYWTTNAERYTDFDVAFILREHPSHPDIELRFVDAIPECAGYDPGNTLGCSPLYTEPGQAQSPSVIEIRTDLTDNSTVQTIKHELGHALGIRHGEPPMPLMASVNDRATLLPVTNASDRPLPYRDHSLSVHVQHDRGIDAAIVDRELSIVLDYYESGADSWLNATPTFTRTENRSDAEIVLRITTSPECGFSDGGVCLDSLLGEQLDSDPAYEYYSKSTVVVANVDPDHLAWFIGYGFGFALGAENATDLPPPLQDQANKRVDWWE